ncbi:type II toxin-antitoxin system RelE family toxin [Pleomorphomonas carboxyditropha]|uniref:Cytotoxic translational repressor of toxin-antitoxin stability system n=1 Tax=Pleomorphomonas carboxyditropha TaxID=2023338 RepID=A0A2G9WS69_9HYPH|nr:type II toxin-antitoxin system RelE/ParE family toxin [Pleomorphomonas carboxyditropha]PIO97547.1 cytotoxic translational repressor of toxin-antitoxin stability system [Pleomorphomonas carboxyditropha]
MKVIAYSKDALKTLRRMPANTASTILAKVAQYAADPASLANNVKSLAGMPSILRLRVGDWRVLFSEDGEVIAIIRIAPRGGVYE